MAKKLKRNTIGSIVKSKDATKPDYIKIANQDVVLKAGSFVNLESAAYQLQSAKKAQEAGKISEDVYRRIEERVLKIPSWVRFEIVQLLEE